MAQESARSATAGLSLLSLAACVPHDGAMSPPTWTARAWTCRGFLALGWLALAGGCGDSPAPAPPIAPVAPAPAPGASAPAPGASARGGPASQIVLRDEAAARGLSYVNRSGEAEKRTILEANGPGVCVLDLQNDGDLDIVFSQGLGSLRQLLDGPGADLEVYVNDGTGHFGRVSGPGLSGWWTGLASGDLDADGDCDLIAAGYGGLEVLLQGPDGMLARAPNSDLIPTAEGSAGARLVPGSVPEAGRAPWWATSIALGDFNRDGALDLFVGQYLELDPRRPPLSQVGEGALGIPCRWKGQDVFCGPHGLTPQPDRVLFGRGDGTFEDRTLLALGSPAPAYALGVAIFDADSDGDCDVYVANDSMANSLWINDGTGKFQDRAFAANVALSMDGAPEAGMGIAVGDIDRNGGLDFALTNFSGEPTEVFFSAPVGFDNRTYRMGLARESKALLSWSVHLFDVDADGALELFTANGHVYPQADAKGTGTTYGQAATLWRLPPEGRVRLVGADGPDSILAAPLGARGSAIGDLDGDGDLDLVLARIDGPAALGINRSHGAGQRLLVKCEGPLKQADRADKLPRTPRDATGARVYLRARDSSGRESTQMFEVHTASGYQSASSPWAFFGLGSEVQYTELRVVWPSGRIEVLGGGQANRRLTVREGEGIVAEEKLP